MEIVFEYDRWLRGSAVVKVKELIIEDDGVYFYIKEEYDKISEIIQMPGYIKDDWIKYNREELTIKQIDLVFKDIEKDRLNEQVKYVYNIPYSIGIEEKLQKLKSIRRDLVLKKI